MTDDHRAVYEALVQATASSTPSALATIIATEGSIPRHTGSKMLVYADGQIVGTVGGGAMESRVIAVAQSVIQSGVAQTETYTLNDIANGDAGICGGTATIFIEPIYVPPTLLVIGGGHVGKAVADLGKWLGYRVVLSDDRPDFCNPEYAPNLDDYIVCKPNELVDHIDINERTYITAVTRGLPIDVGLIPALLQTTAAYIGLIGSRRRWALTMKALQEEYGITNEQLQRIHAPIGLELEAESPKEIALSILAEITMIRHGGTGKPMRWIENISELKSTNS